MIPRRLEPKRQSGMMKIWPQTWSPSFTAYREKSSSPDGKPCGTSSCR